MCAAAWAACGAAAVLKGLPARVGQQIEKYIGDEGEGKLGTGGKGRRVGRKREFIGRIVSLEERKGRAREKKK